MFETWSTPGVTDRLATAAYRYTLELENAHVPIPAGLADLHVGVKDLARELEQRLRDERRERFDQERLFDKLIHYGRCP